MSFLHLIWLIPLLPLAGFVINGLLGKRMPRPVVSGIACLAVLASLVLAVGAIRDLHDQQGLADMLNNGSALSAIGARPGADGFGAVLAPTDPDHGLVLDPSIPRARQIQWTWLSVGNLSVKWGYSLDPLSAIMLLVVLGVGFLIHVYSIGYMAHDEGFARFFAYLNLFMAMMLVLILADSFLVMFVGWEGVGLCSYLLIGFNYRDMFNSARDQSCADAGRKAFIVNRIGDFGFMLGMLLILVTFGSLDFGQVFRGVHVLAQVPGSQGLLTAMALLLFVGATGKSAQIPLFVWLPDAMAGPTPVSALIHAATMVTAGVYMVCRCAALFTAAPLALTVVAVVGGLTALLAAAIACTQTDIKKVLAYSTVSQLGYMFLAAGVGAFSFAIFHVMTHAFFKALLFLGAGSVIHALSGEQDIRRMGRLTRVLPWTFGTFAVAAVAIAGIPPFAGFFSKDSILAAVFYEQPILWVAGAFTAGLTAFYIWRLVFLTFLGSDRVEKERRGHLHESPWSMVAPLVMLAFLATVGGFLGVPAFLAESVPGLHAAAEWLPGYLEPVFREAHVAGAGMGALGFHDPAHGAQVAAGSAAGHGGVTAAGEWGLMALSVLLALAGIAWAWLLHGRAGELAARLAAALGGGYRLARDRFRIDELYDRILLKPFYFMCRAADAFDRFVIDLLVNLVAIATEITGHVLKLFQTGSVRAYALSVFIGVVALVTFLVMS